MIYLLLDLYNLQQIKKINNKIEIIINKKLKEVSNCKIISISGNSFILNIGDQKSLYPSQLINSISKINNILNSIKVDLYGYNIIIQILDENNISQIIKLMISDLINLTEDDSIWIDNNLNDILKNYIDSKYSPPFWKILKIKNSSEESFNDITFKWIRPELLKKINYNIGKRLNYGISKSGLLLIGDNDTGIKNAVYSSIINIIQNKYFNFVPKLFTLFNRQSPVHPFLNSINYELYQNIPEYLNNYELKIWNNKKDIMSYLVENIVKNKCYDSFIKDFYLLYNLYICGYIRMMKKNNLPAFFIAEDIDTYHIDSINTLRILFNDFLNNPDFIPILITNNYSNIDYFKKYNLKAIKTNKISWKEIKSFASFIFPGLQLSKNICSKIMINSVGKLSFIKHNLLFLENKGKIINEDNTYKLQNLKEKKINFKKDNKLIILSIINKFSTEQKEILYIICLLSGILSLKTFFNFLDTLGYSESSILSSIRIFTDYSLVSRSSTIISNFNFLKKNLESQLKNDNAILKEKLFRFIIKNWKENRFSHLILLFYFFIRNEYFEYACKILPSILNRKFNEMDFHGILQFLDSIEKMLKNLKDKKLKTIFKIIILSSKLRFFIFKDDFKKAAELLIIIQNKIDIYSHSREKGILLLNISSYYFYKSDIHHSIDVLKESLLETQDHGTTEDKANIYLNMGCYFLAEGKIDEALDYLNFSDKLLNDESFEKLRCLTQKCIVYYILNKLSKITPILKTCLRIANFIGKREWEVYIYLLMGRLSFQLGDYEKASISFQKGINIIKLYSFASAYKIFARWLCRSEIYSGKIYKSINTLKNLDTENETLYFLSEGYHFLGSNDKALSILNNAIKNKSKITPSLNEKLLWNNGYSCLEGMCIKLENDIPIIDTFIKYFRAYILSLVGNLDESIKELQLISKKINSAIDLYRHEHYLFYYLSLPKYRINNDSVNRLTLLNKAIAILHDISNRINSPILRSEFLNKNYWNNILYKEAKSNNLI